MEDFKKRLSLLIAEGSSIVQGVESTSFMISLGKIVLPYVLEREDLESLGNFVEVLNLPSPVHQVYIRYIQWNRDCETFFLDFGLEKSFQFGEFVRIRKEVSKEILKENPYQRAILLRIKEQLSIIDGLSKLNLAQLQKGQKKTNASSKIKPRKKLVFIATYILACLIADVILYGVIDGYVFAIIGAEVAILFGMPKLIEWIHAQ
jgi:hypothetical protein